MILSGPMHVSMAAKFGSVRFSVNFEVLFCYRINIYVFLCFRVSKYMIFHLIG